MKQRFKRQILTERKVMNSILRFYSLATISELKEGMNWYNDANQYCRELAARFNITISQVAGILAAFSPQCGWNENKRYALQFLISPNTFKGHEERISKAKTILKLTSEADIYNALSVNDAAWKTKAFFLNILNPDVVTDVTIDRHAIAICIQSPDKTKALSQAYGDLTVGQYRFFEKCYAAIANELDILPQQLQAITWTTYRRLRELRTYENTTGWKPFETDVTF